jgi:hypothetical protein
MNPYKVGDIVTSSWGYDQTNVDFYKVTAVKNSMIEIRQLSQTTTEYNPGCMSGSTSPVENEFHPDFPKTHRKKPRPDGSFKLETWGRWCRPWDGKAKRCSWYA